MLWGSTGKPLLISYRMYFPVFHCIFLLNRVLQYFVFDILLLIGAGVGAYFVFTGQLDVLKEPFMEALRKYDDTSNVAADKTLVSAWNTFQQDVRYISTVTDSPNQLTCSEKFQKWS